jgi:hypothetical protein
MTERLSISLPDDVAAMIRAHADKAGWSISTWIVNAARLQAENDRLIADGLAASNQWEAVHGQLTEEELEQADNEFLAAGAVVEGNSRAPE